VVVGAAADTSVEVEVEVAGVVTRVVAAVAITSPLRF
jgi:hypothetical protein